MVEQVNGVLLWIVLVQAVVIFLFCLTVLPLWWCYVTAAAAVSRLERAEAGREKALEQLDEVVARLCEGVGVPAREKT